MKKRICVLLICFLCGCSIQSQKDTVSNQTDHLSLTKSRVQIALNTQFDYLQYVSCDSKKDVQYNIIDTSKIGTYVIHYKYHNDSEDFIVDVVKMYKNKIFNPIGIKTNIIKNPKDITVLVNKLNQIPDNWVPDDLVKVVDSHQKLRQEAAQAYKEFYQAAKSQGINIYSISGYRSNETQTLYWNNQVKVRGEEYASQYSAYPLRSEHQLGLAIDVSYKTDGDRLNEDVEKSPIGKFIVSDGYKYGYILRYPKDKVSITNYGYEPWHIRYVGKALAKKLHQSHMTLEEYYEVMN